MMHIRNTFQEHLRSIVDSIPRKEPKSWQKRIVAKDSGICLVMAGAPAQYAKGLGSSYYITTLRQMAG